MLKRTALFAEHQKLGARLVEFGGWEMPLHYSGILDEHLAVRAAAGMFDISHMGEIFVSGAAAARFLNETLTNDIERLSVGLGQYTLMCHELGGVIDDLYAYQTGPAEFLLMVNASRIEADLAWLEKKLSRFAAQENVHIQDRSPELGAIAVQGPAVARFIDRCFPHAAGGSAAPGGILDLKKNQILRVDRNGRSIYAARTGYTGEDGFEIIAPNDTLAGLWNSLLEAGAPLGLKPAGLGARDTLRTEMGYPLYGHELDENTTPIEAGLKAFVALNKPELTGGEIFQSQAQGQLQKRCVAFKMAGASPPPRPRYAIFARGKNEKLGEVVSGTQSPSLGIGIGLGYIPPTHAAIGTPLDIVIRDRGYPAVVVPKPIYRKPV